eukprot:9072215-Pyramimonas_sp.AAC.1
MPHASALAHCSVVFAKKHYRPTDIANVLYPGPEVRGRGGVVEVHRGVLRMRCIVAYFAPRPAARGKKAWAHLCSCL